MIAEVMGHNTGWLTLGAGLAGGADAILLPEIPFEVQAVADSILQRKAGGSSFSIVAVAEGAMSAENRARHQELRKALDELDKDADDSDLRGELKDFEASRKHSTERLAEQLEDLTGLEARVTILGHVQRGGSPSTADRLLATQLGTAAADAIAEGTSGVMIAMRDGQAVEVPLSEIAGNRKTVPLDHPWIESARRLDICLGD